ncbi:MAG: hypothetical protein H7842_09715 [Gammaproteobacteria bacterium SHHR-1]
MPIEDQRLGARAARPQGSTTLRHPGHSQPDNLRLMLGSSPEDVARQRPLPLFSAEAMGFLGALSKALLPSDGSRVPPELAALGFWLRPAALGRLQAQYCPDAMGQLLRPVGCVFHLPPANVPTLFVYGWALSLLAGNANIIRISSRQNPLTKSLLAQIGRLLAAPEHSAIRQRSSLLSYGHDEQITEQLSALCARRLVWGGDATVRQIRRIPLPPLAQEIVFPDRHSCSLIQADALLRQDNLTPLIQALYRDIFAFQQQACSSPRVLFWLGKDADIQAARARLWPEFDAFAEAQPHTTERSDAMEKLICLQQMALGGMVRRIEPGSRLTRLQVHPGTSAQLLAYHCGHGILLEEPICQLQQLSDYPGPRMQTLSTWGCPAQTLHDWLQQDPMPPLDRLVPLGQALRFDAIWDGLDLLRQLTRTLYRECSPS